jgi:hypothetical protein
MNKKFIQTLMAKVTAFVVLFALSVTGISSVYAMVSSEGNGYNTPVIISELNFSAVLSSGKVETNWSVYAPSGFNYYKVVRSTTNSNPVYPDDGYIYYGSDPNVTSYTDTDTPSGTVYYRVCSIASPNRYCSPVVTLKNDSVATEKPVETVITNANSLTLSAEMKTDGVQLNWSVDGTTPKGVKVAISTVNENPTYPVMDGDSYRYLADSSTRSYKETMVSAGDTYHYRVCQYDGAGKCLVYSNSVSVTVPSDYVKSSVQSEDGKVDFSDSNNHLYKTAIGYLKDKAVVQGYDDGTFRPDNTINRAEFMKIVIGAKYSQDYIGVSSAWNCFSDVTDEWFAPYICIAKDEGVVSGYADGTFKPSQNISFVEAAKILAEVYGLDFTKMDVWYEGYVKALQENNYIPSTISSLNKAITRAEMAELIWRIKEQKKDQSYNTLISDK